MKLKLSELNANPFKKRISKGKLSEVTISKIKSNIKELGLMGALPVFKRNKKYFLISGHHRVEALKRVFGKDFKIEVILHDYDDDQVMRGMVVENLTQRDTDLKETAENLAAIREHLKSACSDSEQAKRKDMKGIRDIGSVRDIYDWLNKNGEVLSIGRISECLNVYDNLSPELIKEVQKTQAGTAKERDEALQETQAIYLAKFDDHKEQKDLMRALKTTRAQRVRDQGRLITKYKEAKQKNPEIAKEIREGKRDLADVDGMKTSPLMKQSNEEKALWCSTEVRAKLGFAGNEMEILTKEHIHTLSKKELFTMAEFLRSWGISVFAPFYKTIIKELADKDSKYEGGIFVFKDEDIK